MLGSWGGGLFGVRVRKRRCERVENDRKDVIAQDQQTPRVDRRIQSAVQQGAQGVGAGPKFGGAILGGPAGRVRVRAIARVSFNGYGRCGLWAGFLSSRTRDQREDERGAKNSVEP